jgi:hypothetical protein
VCKIASWCFNGAPMLPILGWSKPFSMPKAAGMQLLLPIRNSPGALALMRTNF